MRKAVMSIFTLGTMIGAMTVLIVTNMVIIARNVPKLFY